MNPAPAQAIGGEKTSGSSWVWALLGLAVCFVAISSQSLWIDEAFMARKAAQPTFTDWWRMMPEGNGSDLQMPLYMIYMWGFAKIFGLSEWALRAANIPWFVAGVAAFIAVFPKLQRLAAAAVTLLCPFAWFYLNEARPYAMQIGSSLAIFAALYRLSGGPLQSLCERNWIMIFWLGIIVLCGSSLLGVIWAGGAFLCLLFLFSLNRLKELLRAHWLACFCGCVCLALLAGYYVWTIKFGARGLEPANQQGGGLTTAVKSAAHFRQGSAGGSELENLAFIAYELFGFSGIGPGRLEIRTEKLHAFLHFAPQLALYAITVATVLLLGVRRLGNSFLPLKRIGLAMAILLPAFVLATAGYLLGFLVLARHCAPVVPVLLFLLSLGIVSGFSRGCWISKTCVGTFIILSLISCLSLRFAGRHEKDDYRDAARTANTALKLGQKVWWSAGEDGALYYRLPLAEEPGQAGRALLVLNPTPQSLAALAAPDVIITSKPDLYDNREALAKYVRNNPYIQIGAFPAFTIWQQKTNPNKQ